MRTWSLALGVLLVAWPSGARAEGETLDLGGMVLELRRIPKGSFTQGDPTGEPDETRREVSITRDFWLGKVPVTRGQFTKFTTETRYVTEAEKGTSGGSGWDGRQLTQKREYTWRNPGFSQTDDDPVVLVTFGDAHAFTAWAGRKTGRRVRLPTEAEWEYAARAGTVTPWYGGKTEDDALAIGWFKPNAGSGTRPVGQKKPNAFGLFDMSGNVYEWCRDVYAPYPTGNAIDPEATAHTGGDPERRVLRGGSWLRDPKRGRSADRHRNTPGSRNADNGFRVAVYDDDSLAPNLGLGSGAATSSPVALGSSRSSDPVRIRSVSEPVNVVGYVVPSLVAAGIAVLWLALRRRSRDARSPQGILTTAAKDGFWVSAPRLPPGARVRYVCVVNGVEVSDVVPLDGGDRTFVYTGAEPTAIRIVSTIVVPEIAFRGAKPPPPAAPPSTVIIDDDSARDLERKAALASHDPFLGFPRAY
jgi:formylglycine-generating enzyme required for sulfatase activity